MPDYTHRMAAAQQFLTHIERGDYGPVLGLMSDQVTYRSQGNNALSGLFIGRDAVARHLQQLFERTRGTFEAFKWDDWLIGEHHAVGLASVHAQSNGRIYKGRTLTVVGFNMADEIDGVTVFMEDQSAMDRFIGP
jgi:ketosteroid isomerase-like protein